ncbi:lipoprotein [compost metagenome]
MQIIKKIAATTSVAALLLSLTACANMSAQDKNTAIGAGVGAVGGVIGNQVKPK